MDRLWSPWRARHVEEWAAGGEASSEATDTDTRSLFTRLVEDNKDEEHLILWRGTHVFVLMNLYPYNNGHLMVIPFRQVAGYQALTSDEQQEMAQTLDRCLGWLREALRPDGFNVGMNLGAAAGAGIPDHLHMHVVPRWHTDTNFMPVTAEAKVIPEALSDTYAKLRAVIDADSTA